MVNQALELKPFVNSEHTGDYIEVLLPGELPQPKKSKKVKEAEAEQELEQEREPLYERIKIHYTEAGTGEPLILVHSVGQSLYTWRKQFQRLSEYYRVIAMDLPGHGYSDRPYNFGYTVQEQADILRLFMDAMGIESAHMIGFSIGAMYVLDFLRRFPERSGRALLISPGGITPEMPLIIRMMDSPILGAIAAMLINLKTVRSLLEEGSFDLTGITDETVREYYKTIADSESKRAVRMSIHNFDEEEVLKGLRNIRQDILILYGAEDKWRTMEELNILLAALPNSRLVPMRNTGHLTHEEKPDRLIEAVLEHIPVIVE